MNAATAALVALPVLALVPPLYRVVAATGPAVAEPLPDGPASDGPALDSPGLDAPALAGPEPAAGAAGVPGPPSLGLHLLTTAGVAVAVAVALRAHPAWLPAYLYLAGVGVALAIVDLRVHRLPDVLTLPSYPVLAALFGLAAAFDGGSGRWVRAVIAGGIVWLLFAALWMMPGGGLGYGDVKLSGLIGAALGWLGWGSVPVGLLIAMIAAGAVAAALLVSGRANRHSRIAYGPYLLAGTLAAILLAHPA
jgi:leader peptidase (prepilin peptidase)/N-methyltransferase